MKRLISLTFLLIVPLVAVAQSDRRVKRNEPSSALFLDQAPESSFPRWFATQPEAADILVGTEPFAFSFSVDHEGRPGSAYGMIGNDTVILHRVRRLLANSPDWTPARQRRRGVETHYLLTRINPDDPITLSSTEDSDLVTPTFNGGDIKEFYKWVITQVQYPSLAWNSNRQGTVDMLMCVDKQGITHVIEVISSPDTVLATEATRVIVASPRWEPGSIKGVPAWFIFPVDIGFHLRGSVSTRPYGMPTP